MTAPAENTLPAAQGFVPQQPLPHQVVVPQGYGMAPQRFGHPGQVRSAGMVFLLTWVTLGFYGFYIHFKLNKEMKEFTSAVNVSPGLATFALIIPIASLVTMIGTSSRVGQTRASIGLRADTSGLVTFLCMFVGANWAYQQSKLNGAWQHVVSQSAPR